MKNLTFLFRKRFFILVPVVFGLCTFLFINCSTPSISHFYWDSLGYVSAGSAGEYWETYSPTAIAFSLVDKKPIVAFRDGGAIKIKKWSSGTNWTDLGSPGWGYYPSLTIDPSD
ncbi:hypothetical protein LCGC14_2444040, partial [marine sediment metagenome]